MTPWLWHRLMQCKSFGYCHRNPRRMQTLLDDARAGAIGSPATGWSNVVVDEYSTLTDRGA